MRSIQELRLEIKNMITLNDKVEAVIYKSGKTDIPKVQSFLQQAFFTLKASAPGLFSELIFDESGVTPFSDELDAALFWLEASAILPTPNPTYTNYSITKSEHLKNAYDKFSEDSTLIDSCALLFSQLVEQQGQ